MDATNTSKRRIRNHMDKNVVGSADHFKGHLFGRLSSPGQRILVIVEGQCRLAEKPPNKP